MNVKRGFKNMNIFGRATKFSRSRLGVQILVALLSSALLIPTWPQNVSAYQDAQAPAQAAQAQPYMQQTPEKLQQLVAPIELYPDSLVAQIMAPSTFPAQIFEADRWVEGHPALKGVTFVQAVQQLACVASLKAPS